jgi:hypothetical protein
MQARTLLGMAGSDTPQPPAVASRLLTLGDVAVILAVREAQVRAGVLR